MDEIADLLGELPGSDTPPPAPPEEPVISEPAPEAKAAPKKRRTSRRKRTPVAKEVTMEELDKQDLLPPETPKPTEKVRGLGDLYAKYRIGDDPQFRVHVYRLFPKIAPGGRKFDGFYDEWDSPLSEQQLQAEYGGGEFRIVIQGPHPDDPRKWKHYESLRVQLAGDPKWERQPRALRQGDTKGTGGDAASTSGNPAPLPMPSTPEHPKVVETAMKMMADTVTAEREERRRIEERANQVQPKGEDPYVKHAIDAERRRADEVSQLERERREEQRRQREEEREKERREREELRREIDGIRHRPQPSIGEELSKLAQAGIFRSDDGGVAKEMMTQILERHRGEMDALHRQHQTFIESIRNGHETQIAALREAHMKEMAAEREASRAREDRVNERLQSEREERRRDQENHRKQVEERDVQWRDRMESQKQMLEQTWESRHTTSVSTFEQRLQWKDQEIDRMRAEMHDLKMKQEEKGDVFSQLAQIKQLQDAVKGFQDPQPTIPSGGIGLSGSGSGGDTPEWLKMIAESPVAERLVTGLMGGGGGGAPASAPPQQPQLQEGQVLTHNMQGQPFPEPMIVVRDPASGQLALAPQQAVEAHNRAIAQSQQQQQRGGPPQSSLLGPPPRRGSRQVRQRTPDVVPNLAEGLEKPKPPWEPVQEPSTRPAPQPERPPQQPLPSLVTPPPSEDPGEPMKLNQAERQVLGIIAKHVHESVLNVSEPHEFVEEMLTKYPRPIVEQIVKGYTTADIIRGVIQVQPSGAGATPAGRHFMQQAIKMLRAAVQ